jgi:hypothetical protein
VTRPNYYFGPTTDVPVIESLHAVERVPKRLHKHKACYKLHYHARIQKKWNKRFGFYDKPTMYFGATDSGRVLFVHPHLMPKVREALRQQRKSP